MSAPIAQHSNTSMPPRVLIIGAGINGCGVFRDLCLQGIECLLVDRGDICEGASAAPSRLIHGGIKYLEAGEFRLVRESCIERNRLLRNAPHYVKPLETLVPVRSLFGGLLSSTLRFLGLKVKLNDRGVLITEIGLRLYDFYSHAIQALPNHRFFNRAKLRQEVPLFDPTIIAAGLYYEGRVTHGERLGLELVLDGLHANPSSQVALYSTVARSETGQFQLTDQLTSKVRTIEADYIINAGGAWIDNVNHSLGFATHYMGGSKGSHLIVAHAELFNALNGRMVYFGTTDGRVNLAYPFFGHVLIGSTDIKINHPDEAYCSDEEIDYLLGAIKEIFPTIKLDRDQIILTYCGVRPLTRSDGTQIGDVSRDHYIAHDVVPGTSVPLISLIGGKWTTFRAFADEAANLILAHFGTTRVNSTEDEAIGGGRHYPTTEIARKNWLIKNASLYRSTSKRIEELLDRYGTRAELIASIERDRGFEPLTFMATYSREEIVFLCHAEYVHRLSDIVLRRTEMAMAGQINLLAIREIAELVANELAWDQARVESEIDNTIQEMERRRVRLVA